MPKHSKLQRLLDFGYRILRAISTRKILHERKDLPLKKKEKKTNNNKNKKNTQKLNR
jgi:hypothetical protein